MMSQELASTTTIMPVNSICLLDALDPLVFQEYAKKNRARPLQS